MRILYHQTFTPLLGWEYYIHSFPWGENIVPLNIYSFPRGENIIVLNVHPSVWRLWKYIECSSPGRAFSGIKQNIRGDGDGPQNNTSRRFQKRAGGNKNDNQIYMPIIWMRRVQHLLLYEYIKPINELLFLSIQSPYHIHWTRASNSLA